MIGLWSPDLGQISALCLNSNSSSGDFVSGTWINDSPVRGSGISIYFSAFFHVPFIRFEQTAGFDLEMVSGFTVRNVVKSIKNIKKK